MVFHGAEATTAPFRAFFGRGKIGGLIGVEVELLELSYRYRF